MRRFWRTALRLLGIASGTKTPANSPPIEGSIQRVELNSLIPGPIQHEGLSEDLIRRADAILISLDGLLATRREEWLDGFQRDRHPEKEIAIWEAVVDALNLFDQAYDSLTADQRSEALGLLLMRSGDTAEAVIASTSLKALSMEQAAVLLSFYSDDPKPITVIGN